MSALDLEPSVTPRGDASSGAPGDASAPAPSDVMTVPEVAELLRLNLKSTYEMVANGTIPGIRRMGRTVRVWRPDLLAWLASGQRSASSRKAKR